MIKNLKDLEMKLQSRGVKPSLGVVCAHDEHTLQALRHAQNNGLIQPVLIGREPEIRKLLDKLKISHNGLSFIHIDNDEESAAQAVKMVREKEITALMKGKIHSGVFLKAVVNSETGIKKEGRLLSHLAVLEVPGYHKIFGVTDGGMVITPGLKEKKSIIENSVRVFRGLGYHKPKVAVLAAVETVNPRMKDTVDADALKNMEWSDCLVEGPVSYDLTFSPEAAAIKNYSSEVTGDADILIMPDISTGNILCKALLHSAGAKMAGIITGAEVPIVMTSRGASADEKYYSIVLSSL